MHRVDHLADTQERILRCIRRHIAGRSRASVPYQLIELEAKCAIVREPGRIRGVRLP